MAVDGEKRKVMYLFIFNILAPSFDLLTDLRQGCSHRLRPIDTHLALYPMLYNNSAKNRYAKPVLNKNKANIENQELICPLFSDKRKRYVSKRTLHTCVNASN